MTILHYTAFVFLINVVQNTTRDFDDNLQTFQMTFKLKIQYELKPHSQRIIYRHHKCLNKNTISSFKFNLIKKIKLLCSINIICGNHCPLRSRLRNEISQHWTGKKKIGCGHCRLPALLYYKGAPILTQQCLTLPIYMIYQTWRTINLELEWNNSTQFGFYIMNSSLLRHQVMT